MQEHDVSVVMVLQYHFLFIFILYCPRFYVDHEPPMTTHALAFERL